MSWFGYTKYKIKEFIDFIKLQFSVLMITHFMACVWIYIGKSELNGWVQIFLTKLNLPDYDPSVNLDINMYDNMFTIYINATYFILTTITTTGYGDITGTTTSEYLFSMCVEFIGLTFFSFLTGTISVMFSGK